MLANGDISDGQRRAAEIRISKLEKNQDYYKRMEPYSSRNVMGKVLDAGNTLATNVDRFVTGKVGDTVSGFSPTMGANILDSVPPVYEAKPPRELSREELEFENIRSGKVVPAIDAMNLDTVPRQLLADETRRQQNQIVNTIVDTDDKKKKVNDAIVEVEKDQPPVIQPDVKDLPEPNPKEIPEAEATLKSFFGDIFDSKELKRAAVLYLGARMTGLNGNQALAFAGKQYINRTDAKENTYQKVAMSGKYTKETLALYKKSMDPSILALKSVPLVNMGIVEERFDTRSGRRYTAMKMKNPTTDSMVWVMPDGKTPVDYNLSTTDARYAKGTPENATYMRGLSDQFTKSVKEFEELDANRTSGENINERTKLVQIGPSAFGDAAAKYMIDNGVTEQAMTGIVANVYDEMVVDLKNKKVKGLSQASIDGYFQRAWIESKTGNATVFMLADKKTPVPTANVRSFFETVKRAVYNSGVEILNDTQFSSFLMQDEIYK